METLKKLVPFVTFGLIVVAAIAGIGYLQPLEHVARSELVVRKPVDEVWPIVADLERWPSWVEEFDSVSKRGRSGEAINYQASSEWGDIPLVVERLRPPRELVTFMDAGKFVGRWHFVVEEVPAGTQVTITEHGEVKNPLFRGLRFFTDEHASIKSFQRALANRLAVASEPRELDLTLEGFQSELARRDQEDRAR